MMVELKSVLVVSGAQYVAVILGALMKQGWFVLSWDIHVKASKRNPVLH